MEETIKAAMELGFYRAMKISDKEALERVGVSEEMLSRGTMGELRLKCAEASLMGLKEDVFEVDDVRFALSMVDRLAAFALVSMAKKEDFSPDEKLGQLKFFEGDEYFGI